MRLLIRVLFSMLLAATAQPAALSTLSLDGDWYFLADPNGSLDVHKLDSAPNVRPTHVPSSWQSQFADLRDYAGVAWYWRTVSVEQPTADQVALLRFGAVDYKADVYVNGQKAGSHEGGYLPFEIDATSLLRGGKNQIAVRVVDPGAEPNRTVEGINYAEIPHGKQNWYIQTSGLWQSVELDFCPRVRLGNVHIAPTTEGSFVITVPVIRAGSADSVRASAELRDPAGKMVWQGTSAVGGSENSSTLRGLIHAPDLWSPARPNLYELRVTLASGDSASCRFGFRSFGTHDGKFYLNGQPIYLRGALDQDFYPDTAYTPPALDYVRDEMRKAKALAEPATLSHQSSGPPLPGSRGRNRLTRVV
jgi:beta-galactosidase/beta-glucuronidase